MYWHDRIIAQDRICVRHTVVMENLSRLLDARDGDAPIWPEEWEHDFPCITKVLSYVLI
jgi:hypothetical protein